MPSHIAFSKTLKAAGTYVRENLNVIKQYGGWFTPGDIESVEDLAPDTGAVVRRRLPDRYCKLAAMSMAAAFGGGDLAGGIVSGLAQLSEHAGKPYIAH